MNLHQAVRPALPYGALGWAVNNQPCNAPRGCTLHHETPWCGDHHPCFELERTDYSEPRTEVWYCTCDTCNFGNLDHTTRFYYPARPDIFDDRRYQCRSCLRGEHHTEAP
jgi:hypothetical protein